MKIITLHCDYIKFKPLKKAIKLIKDIKDKKEKQVKEPLVVLIAVEAGDSQKEIKQLIDAVKKTAKEVKAKNIVLYPYAHLSSNLAPPNIALTTLDKAEKLLKKQFKVTRAPFGYYKSFELKVKGHPLSELSKTFGSTHTDCCFPIKEESEVEADYDPKQLLREISRSKLDTSKLKENDHRILGQKLDLFSFHESAPGQPFWHHKGKIIWDELEKYWKEVHQNAGYEIISTPQILDNRLWKISGHWKLYKDHMFLTKYEGRDFAIKPMNCPGCMLVYKTKTRSYKDLPLRLGEIGIVHRKELSGVLSGLFRVLRITQDDAHIFCTEEQLESEIVSVIKLFIDILSKFGFRDHRFTLSVRSKKKAKKYLGTDALWKKAESSLEKALKKLKLKFDKEEGEAKFYGPSLDVQIKDSMGREWQCSTLQLDFNLANRFELEYTDKNGKGKTPVVLHRVVFGSMERFIGILLEHYSGSLPIWLSPIQARILSFTDRNIKAVEKLADTLRKEGIRVDSDLNNNPISGKVRDAEMQKIPYIIVIGDKEEKAKTLAVRERGKKPKFGVKEDFLIKNIKEKIEKRD